MKTLIVTEETVYSGIFKVLFNDIITSGDACLLSKYFCENNRLKKVLVKLLYKNSINKILNNRFDNVVKPSLCLEKWIQDNKNEECVVIFTNASLQKVYNFHILSKIKEKYLNVSYVLLLVDSSFQAQAKNAIALSNTGIFDLVYTYDKEDSEKYKFIHWLTPYSKLNNLEPDDIVEGVFFCGSDKGRISVLDDIADVLKKYDIDYDFEVSGRGKHAKNFVITNDGVKEYKDILKKTLQYKVILDVCQSNQMNNSCGLSLRVYESFVYGRILITNNPRIKDFPFYNNNYMYYFENPNDIDSRWIKNSKVYDYHGELSPFYLLQDIKKKLNKL